MSNRIDSCFAGLAEENRKALITFITAGDPDLETSEKNVLAMLDNGADIVEIGVPFSDPIAEGPTIQKASLRALEGGVNLDEIFKMVVSLRKKTDKPLLLMMYLNTIFRYGTEKFFALCRENQIDGVIVPDMPFEERDEVKAEAEKNGIYNIFLVAPTSKERVRMISDEAKGFLYVVSSLGVTGTRKEINTDFTDLLAPIRDHKTVPACIGFGISDPAQAKAMSQYADGVIIGSAIVSLSEKYGKDAHKYIGEFVKGVREALDA
ncbi:MAG: tryptophan synthase subunit alpha [Ruminococcus sp.]|nr:tryptophan synthase subunit alpha [Ruminococcus sp.]